MFCSKFFSGCIIYFRCAQNEATVPTFSSIVQPRHAWTKDETATLILRCARPSVESEIPINRWWIQVIESISTFKARRGVRSFFAKPEQVGKLTRLIPVHRVCVVDGSSDRSRTVYNPQRVSTRQTFLPESPSALIRGRDRKWNRTGNGE